MKPQADFEDPQAIDICGSKGDRFRCLPADLFDMRVNVLTGVIRLALGYGGHPDGVGLYMELSQDQAEILYNALKSILDDGPGPVLQ